MYIFDSLSLFFYFLHGFTLLLLISFSLRLYVFGLPRPKTMMKLMKSNKAKSKDSGSSDVNNYRVKLFAVHDPTVMGFWSLLIGSFTTVLNGDLIRFIDWLSSSDRRSDDGFYCLGLKLSHYGICPSVMELNKLWSRYAVSNSLTVRILRILFTFIVACFMGFLSCFLVDIHYGLSSKKCLTYISAVSEADSTKELDTMKLLPIFGVFHCPAGLIDYISMNNLDSIKVSVAASYHWRSSNLHLSVKRPDSLPAAFQLDSLLYHANNAISSVNSNKINVIVLCLYCFIYDYFLWVMIASQCFLAVFLSLFILRIFSFFKMFWL